MFEVIGLICIGIALAFLIMTGMSRERIPEEEQVLRAERDDLLAQATAFFEEDDYELLPELFSQIAEVSFKLGDRELAEGFKRKAEEIRALFISQDAPFEPEILASDEQKMPPVIPSEISSKSEPPIEFPKSTKPLEPQPSMKLTPLPVLKETPSKKPKDALTEKIEKLKNLLNSIPTSELNAPTTQIPIIPPSIPADESKEIILPSIGPETTKVPPVIPIIPPFIPADESKEIILPSIGPETTKVPPVILPSIEPAQPKEPPLVAPSGEKIQAPSEEPPLIAPSDEELQTIALSKEPPLVAPSDEEIQAIAQSNKPVSTEKLLNILGSASVETSPIASSTETVTKEELLDILGPAPVEPPSIAPSTKLVTTEELLDILGPAPIKSVKKSVPVTSKASLTKESTVKPPITSETQSLIKERRVEQGEALQSGIIPKIVKSEEEIIREILDEKVPLLPEKDKQKAIEKILTYSPGAAREAWLKVFLIKNKQYVR